MKLTDLTIEKFQSLAAIELSTVFSLHEKRIGVVAIMEDKDPDEVMKMKVSEITRKYKAIVDQWNWLPEMKPIAKFRAGDRWYYVSKEIDFMTSGQLIELMSYDVKSELKMVEDLHLILASMSRRCLWLRWVPEQYDGSGHAVRAEYLRKNAKVGHIWGAIAFFLLTSQEFAKITKDYFVNRIQKMKPVNGKHH